MTTGLRILAATDLSSQADNALKRAIALVKEAGGEMAVISVVDDATEALRRRADLVSRMEAVGVPADATVEIAIGELAPSIVRFAGAWQPSIVVVGAGDVDGGFRMFSETTVEKLIAAAPCPLLTVKSGRIEPYHHVMAAVDFSPAAQVALSTAMEIAPAAHLTLLHVMNFPGGYMPSTLPEAPPDDEVDAFLGDLVLPTGRHEWLVRAGKPKPELAFAARERKADLVALGTAGRSGLLKAILGSVAHEAAESLPSDVLIARAAGAA